MTTDFASLARDHLGDAGDNLSEAQILQGTRVYFADVAAAQFEDHWREQLSTLSQSSPLVAALTAAEWLVKGPAALAWLAGAATPAQASIVETEAQIITAFSPATPKAVADVAAEIAARFEFWVTGGMLLTSLRRATQHRIHAATTPEDCEQAFLFMRGVAEELIAMAADGASAETVMGRIGELAADA